MNNLLLLGLGVVVLFLVMNGSKGRSKSLTKSVSKELKGNGGWILLVVGGLILFMCMNKGLVEGQDDDTSKTGGGYPNDPALAGCTATSDPECAPWLLEFEKCDCPGTKCADCLKSICDNYSEIPGNTCTMAADIITGATPGGDKTIKENTLTERMRQEVLCCSADHAVTECDWHSTITCPSHI